MTTKLADALESAAEALAALALEYRAYGDGGGMPPTRAPDAPGGVAEELPFTDTPQGRSEQGGCPVHGLPWNLRPAGNSKKTGEPYNAFWSCSEQNADGSYCREKPTPAWVKAHPAR